MSFRDAALALIVVIIWGANFTVIKLGLNGVPPMSLVALRYVLSAFPAVLFVPRPAVSARYWIGYGLSVGVGQFACLFYAIHIGMPAGVASVVLQSQPVFTLLLANIFLGEKTTKGQGLGLSIAAAGLYMVARGGVGNTGVAVAIGPFLLTLLAAAFWGVSNIVLRMAATSAANENRRLNVISVVVWSSLVPPVPMALLAVALGEPSVTWSALGSPDRATVFAVLYLAYASTLVGYGIWSRLMTVYPTGKVAPASLLVPVTGLLTAFFVLGEKLSGFQWIGSALAIIGLAVSTLAPNNAAESPH